MAKCEYQTNYGVSSYVANSCAVGAGRSLDTNLKCPCKAGYKEYNPILKDCKINC